MLKIRSLGQPAPAPTSESSWKGAWAAGAFLAVAYFFIKTPETPEWLRGRR